MAFAEVSTKTMDIKIYPDKPIVGIYLGSKGIQTKMGGQIIYRFQARSGRIFSIYGFTNLNIAMENVVTGTLCQITYLGKKLVDTKKFGKKDVHQVRVETEESTDGSPPF